MLEKIEAHALEHEFYWALATEIDWFLFIDKNTKEFQIAAIIRKGEGMFGE